MQRLFSTFPAGRPGIGLLLFRLALAATALMHVPQFSSGGLQLASTIACACISALLAFGLFTPVAAGAGVVMGIASLASAHHHEVARDLTLVLLMLALALIGAGAYSIDARLYGRRRIVVPRQPRLPKE
jgi:uncharacterized membrane protein YphA (DoxX/SURF4 family)